MTVVSCSASKPFMQCLYRVWIVNAGASMHQPCKQALVLQAGSCHHGRQPLLNVGEPIRADCVQASVQTIDCRQALLGRRTLSAGSKSGGG